MNFVEVGKDSGASNTVNISLLASGLVPILVPATTIGNHVSAPLVRTTAASTVVPSTTCAKGAKR